MRARLHLSELRLGLVGPEPPPNGGMAMQTQQLARLLESEGVSVERLATNGEIWPAFIDKVRGIRAVLRFFPYLFALWRLAGRVDVIHVMANSGWAWQLCCAPALWIGWLRNTPVVVNYRGGEAHAYFQRSMRWVRPSLRKAAAIVVPSGYLQDVFEHHGESALIIPNIIDKDLFHPTEGQKSDTFTLVVTRNLEAIYGIDTAIRAFAKAYSASPSLRLRIAGSGPEESSLKALARQLGVENAVTFEGRLDRREIVNLYAQADAALNPTTVDNMPNSVLEALACGLPVISTDVGGVPYIVRHRETALLVPPNDVDAMASAISEIENDASLRDKLSNRGLIQVEQYTWSNVRKQWLDLYLRVCESREQQKVAP